MEGLRRFMQECNSITRLTEEVLTRTGYLRSLEEERSLEAAERLENIKEFLSATQEFDNKVARGELNTQTEVDDGTRQQLSPSSLLGSFLESVTLISDVDRWDDSAQAVTLMTLHAAKGLEFPVVFIVGMEENVFPHVRSKYDQLAMEEERRLCYVGLTRAKEEVYLVHAHRRTLYGVTQDTRLSQFVRDIPPAILHCTSSISTADNDWRPPGYGSQRSEARRRSSGASATGRRFSAEPSTYNHGLPGSPLVTQQYSVGEKVRHAKWGEGYVVKVHLPPDGSPQEWIEVAFPNQDIGIKRLALGIAPLEKVG
jgi:DNA helicase-2/ATP-dependent DNA helicase PcrA